MLLKYEKYIPDPSISNILTIETIHMNSYTSLKYEFVFQPNER